MRPEPVFVSGRRKSDLPIAPATIAGRFVFVSGHVGWNPETHDAPRGIQAQTEQAVKNVQSVLESAGTSLEHVCKTNVYLANMQDFPAMNEVYRRFFPENPPARTTIGAALARADLLIEIEVVALLPE